MAPMGTSAYRGRTDLPPVVSRAVEVAVRTGFSGSCLPEQGQLLAVLARGVGGGVIGETGTGCGVGLAWLASGAAADARLVSVERDEARARVAATLFADDPRVAVRTCDWRVLADAAPFDLLVLDGGGHGKGVDPPLEPARWLRPGGVVVVDDFVPMTRWPPTVRGAVDHARMYWLQHPRLRAAEVRVTPTAASIVATFLG